MPFATFGGPGLIVLLWVAAQAGGASIWIPAARRLRGADAPASGRIEHEGRLTNGSQGRSEKRPGSLRLLGAIVLATTAATGFLIGPPPERAAAALVATGIDDNLTTKHDRPRVVAAPGVLGNDLNLLGGASAILVSGVSHGTLALRGDGGYTYTPAPGYLGADSFRYRPSGLLSTPATVRITVTNAVPVATPDAHASASGMTLLVAAPGVLGNDLDADGDALTAELVGGVASGALIAGSNRGIQLYAWRRILRYGQLQLSSL